MEGEKIFANHIFDKGLISKICEDVYREEKTPTNNPMKKWAKNLHRHFFKSSPEDIFSFVLEREEGREKNIDQLLLYPPGPETEPATRLCSLTENQTHYLPVTNDTPTD